MRWELGGRVWSFFQERLIRRYIFEEGLPDIVHAHNALWGGTAAARIATDYKIPFVLTEHASGYLLGEYSPRLLSVARAVYRSADVVIAVSNALAQSVEAVAGRGPIVRVVPNVVDTHFFTIPELPKANYPISSKEGEEFTIVTIASLNRNKGVHLLIEAFGLAFHNAPAQLLVVGDGPLRKELVDQVQQMSLVGRVQFMGWLDRPSVRAALWRSDVAVSSSYCETFGVALIEAMATGLPVITTASGGPADFVSAPYGHLVPTGDAPALAATLREVHQKWLLRAFPTRSEVRDAVIGRFDGPTVARRLAAIYSEVVLNRKRVQVASVPTSID
jgi:glycosyltransferase involved in cell wall biosynthesis